MLNLPYIDTQNPYYTALKMKLYYEFMIEENLHKVESWRNFKTNKQIESTKELNLMTKQAKIETKEHQILFHLEIECRRNGNPMARKKILEKYVRHPYMQRHIAGKTTVNLATVVECTNNSNIKKRRMSWRIRL